MQKIEESLIIAVVGPPHSGKTVFLYHLEKALKKYNARYFLERACPDGEGTWSAESDQDLVKRIRVKGKFDKKFMDFILKSLHNLPKIFPIVLVDCGGRISEENRLIISSCTHFIIVSSDRDATFDWIDFCQDVCGAEPLAVFDSTLDTSLEPYFDPDDKIGLLVGLDRKGIPEKTKNIIEYFAEYLISFV